MSKAYRGVLKARISKLYGGDVTVEKARKLKNRKDATPRDKQLARDAADLASSAKRRARFARPNRVLVGHFCCI